jgi:TonB-linked SusC/RagA family outer membrane protein
MRKITILLALLLFAASQGAFAQKTITGKVTSSEDGLGMAGVPVVVKGTTKGTATDVDGNFTLSASDDATLVFSFIGFLSQEIKVGTQNVINVSLTPNVTALGDVVVTALGIQRDKKTLTYASQQIDSKDIRVAAQDNFMDALSGKTSGLDIKISSSGAGGSTKAVLRGNKSLVGLSEPLYVVDGIPMVNNKGGQPGSYGGTDGGDGLSALNSDDIESINVLKGANASILYGSQGANGVVLITTKKGKAGRVSVNISSSEMFDQVTSLPEFQFDYGAVGGADKSWSYTKGNYQRDYIKDFFQTGITATNSISVSGGNDKTVAYFSYSNTSAKGTLPTNKYQKNNFSFNQSTKLAKDKITVSSNVMFSMEDSYNRPGAGYYNNPISGLYLFARERDFASYKENYSVFNAARNLDQMSWYSTYEALNNPYWEIYKNTKDDTSWRVIASTKVSWNIAKGLKFDIRGNIDYTDKIHDYRYAAAGNTVSVSPNGKWDYARWTDNSLYSDAILSYDNKFGALSLTALVGASYLNNNFNDGMSVNNGTTNLMYPNFFAFANMPYNIIFNNTINRVIKDGVFANAQLGYKDMIYLDLSARNDWASTLALTGNESYLYPAAGLTAIVSNMVTLPEFMSFAKVRASLSKTSNEIPFNRVNPWNSIGGAGTPDGIGGINRNTVVPFTNMKPEEITSNEYGAEMRFFNGKAGLEFTYYSEVSKNQFLTLAAPSGSGYSTYYINAGKITNKGFELALDVTPVETSDFVWKTSLNMSQNKNKIVELIADNPDYIVGGDDEGFSSLIKAGGSFNDLWIWKFRRDDQGRILIDSKGIPMKAADRQLAGNVNPDYVVGWNNSLTYKNFFAGVLVNGKIGGVAFSKTEAFLDSYGVSKRSGDDRDAGGTAMTMPINGASYVDGAAISSIDVKTYYSAIGDRNNIMEPYVYSRTNIRVAQFVLGYNFDVQSLGLPIKAASLSLIGRNLFFLYKEAPYDPELSMSTSNSMQSNEVFSMPATRTYGFNIKLNF